LYKSTQRGQAASKQGKSARDLKIFLARSWWQDDLKALNHLATMILPTPIIFSLIGFLYNFEL
jgi:hypothetical protein